VSNKDPWYDSDNPSRIARGFGWLVAKWYIAILVFVLVVGGGTSIGLWYFGVATSNIKGQGEAQKIKNSALNRTQAQAQFHADFESVHRFDLQLTDAQVQIDQFKKDHPDVGNGTPYDPLAEQLNNLETTYTGIQQQCRRVVAQYDANAETYTLRDFRDADLPSRVDNPNDPVYQQLYVYTGYDCTVTPGELGTS
jgi:hypothetical protein